MRLKNILTIILAVSLLCSFCIVMSEYIAGAEERQKTNVTDKDNTTSDDTLVPDYTGIYKAEFYQSSISEILAVREPFAYINGYYYYPAVSAKDFVSYEGQYYRELVDYRYWEWDLSNLPHGTHLYILKGV